MRRLLRWLLNGLTVLSLLLCVATAVLWGRSYFVGDTVQWGPDRRRFNTFWHFWLGSGKGVLGIQIAHFVVDCDSPSHLSGPEFEYDYADARGSRWTRAAPTTPDLISRDVSSPT